MGKIAAIVPCYDVEGYCESVIEQVMLYADEVILIDDGSRDGTKAILCKMQQKHPDKVHLILFPTNQGKGAALLAGIKYALASIPFEVLISLDSDGQHLPSQITELVAKLKEGEADLVIGGRKFHQMPFRSRFANRLISSLLCRLFPKAPLDNQSGFRAFNRMFAKEIVENVTGCRYEMEFRCILLALHKGYKVTSCSIHTLYIDKNSSSHFSVFRDSFRILKVFFHYWRFKSI